MPFFASPDKVPGHHSAPRTMTGDRKAGRLAAVTTQLVQDPLAEQAAAAAAAAGVTVRELEGVDELVEADGVLSQVWGGDAQLALPANQQPVSLLRAFAHTGNYLAGAFEGPELVGVSVGFAWGSPEERKLHSHISGVAEPCQGKGVGFALKLHQRSWAACRDYTGITWSFDPLVRRNAWFNLMKLGATIEAYHPQFYGFMNDGLNAGEDSDRCLVAWPVAGEVLPAEIRPTGGLPLLVEGAGGEPVLAEPTGAPDAVYLCQIPCAVVALRREDPALARRWRLALRDTMGAAIQAGWIASRITREGCYVLVNGAV